MNVPGLVFSILAIISGILWVIFFGIPSVSTGDNSTLERIFYFTYNIALSLLGGILGIKYSLKETGNYMVKIIIIVFGIILIATGRLICGILLIMAGALLILKTIYLKKKNI